jgi:hypothetical protein
MAKKRKAPPIPKRGASLETLKKYEESFKKVVAYNANIDKANQQYEGTVKRIKEQATKTGTSFRPRPKKKD